MGSFLRFPHPAYDDLVRDQITEAAAGERSDSQPTVLAGAFGS